MRLTAVLLISLLTLNLPNSVLAQIVVPATPRMQPYQPVSTSKQPNSKQSSNPMLPNDPTPNYPMGATSDDVMRQAMEHSQRAMGATNPEMAARIAAERNREYKEFMAELAQDERNSYSNMHSRRRDNGDTINFVTAKATFTITLQQLKTILANKQPSLATAFFVTENAFGRPWLPQSEYNTIISQSADFIKAWLIENGYKLTDNDALHLGIQKFMSEKLTITQKQKLPNGKTQKQVVTHLPVFYDFNDFTGGKDYSSTFLTKLLATGGGQCSSMPQEYLVLAEKLGAKTYLSFAPNHSFIKYINNSGTLQNYEPTSNWRISDQWYQENMFISPAAIRSGIYLDTLNTRQIIANCLLDLATEYMRIMPLDDGSFVNECLVAAYPSYPRENNIFSYFIFGSFLKGKLLLHMHQNKLTSLDQIGDNYYAMQLLKGMQANEDKIRKLGHQDMPTNRYEEMMQEHEFKGTLQQQQNVSGKEKRNLFITQ